jgi:hypothetical protein
MRQNPAQTALRPYVYFTLPQGDCGKEDSYMAMQTLFNVIYTINRMMVGKDINVFSSIHISQR